MDFRTYLAESEKTYRYRIKTVVPVDATMIASVEAHMKRYNLISVSKLSKTILQKQPLDFSSVQNREVFMLDIELGLPVSSYVIQRELVGVLGIPGDYMVVRGENDPMEIQTDIANQQAAIDAQAEKKGLTPAALLTTNPDYPDADQTVDGQNYYGDAYNGRLLGYLKELSDKRQEEQKVDAPAPLFKWLDMPKPEKAEDFNADLKADQKPADKDAHKVGTYGNFADEGKTLKKTFVNKAGTPQTLKGKSTPVRKG